jgi:fibrillarin-like rRNA methylase
LGLNPNGITHRKNRETPVNKGSSRIFESEKRLSISGKFFHIWTKNRRKIAAKVLNRRKIAAKI